MPELPEVETVVRDLRPRLVGRTLVTMRRSRRRLRTPWAKPWGELLPGRRVEAVRRRGKWIVADLDDGRRLVFHLGMTGQLTVVPAAAELKDHTHLVFALDGGESELRFRDVRRFGSATLHDDESALQRFFDRSGLGPEPFGLDADYWRSQFQKTARCVKAVLLDQRVVAGVGNIYADESLFMAKLHPARLGRDVSAAEAGRLRVAVADVLTQAIKHRGATIRDYVGGSGLKGGYQEEFRVYGRTGEPCRRCRRPVECVRLAGRSSHYCPRCQR